jgi:hypothetical protein
MDGRFYLLGISYNAAWRMKQELMQVMLERDDGNPHQVLLGWMMPVWAGQK